jgi:hypothetical protein
MMLFPKFLDIAMPDYHKWKKRNHKQVAPVYSGTPCPPAWRPGNPLSISCTSPEPFGGGAPRQAMRVENHVGVPLSAMNSLGGQVRMLKASSFSPPFGCQRFPNSWEGERFIVFDQARLVLLRPLIKSVRNYEAAA